MAKINLKELNSELSPDELSEINTASGILSIFDEDSPEMTEQMLLQLKRMRQVFVGNGPDGMDALHLL